MNPTQVSFQLVDQSIKRLQGILEDVLIKVNKIISSTTFIVLDMEEYERLQLVLGRSFPATGQALVNV